MDTDLESKNQNSNTRAVGNYGLNPQKICTSQCDVEMTGDCRYITFMLLLINLIVHKTFCEFKNLIGSVPA